MIRRAQSHPTIHSNSVDKEQKPFTRISTHPQEDHVFRTLTYFGPCEGATFLKWKVASQRRGKVVEKRLLVAQEWTKFLPITCDCAGATSYGSKPVIKRRWRNGDKKGPGGYEMVGGGLCTAYFLAHSEHVSQRLPSFIVSHVFLDLLRHKTIGKWKAD